MNPPANWYPDPTGRHGQRYWDGEQWTEHVFTDGVQAVDPLEQAAPASEEPVAQDGGLEQVEEMADGDAAGDEVGMDPVRSDEEPSGEELPQRATAAAGGLFEDAGSQEAWSPTAVGDEHEEAVTADAGVAPDVEAGDVVATLDEVGNAGGAADSEAADGGAAGGMDAPPVAGDMSDAFVLAPETASRIVKRRATEASEAPSPAEEPPAAEEPPTPEEPAAADDPPSADEPAADGPGAIDAPPPTAAIPTEEPAVMDQPPPTAAAGGGLGITGDLLGGAFAERSEAGPVALQNSRLLRCSVTQDHAVVARQGTMVAYQGDVSFDRQGAGGVTRALKRAATGEGLAMMRAEGAGDVFFADGAQHVFLLQLEGGPGLSVNGRNVLAFSAALEWDIERVKGASLLAGGLFNTTFTGTGWVALVSDGEPVVLRTDEAPTHVDVNALVAWSAGLSTRVVNTVSAKSLVGLGSGEAFQMAFDGPGVVIVQPSEGPMGGAAAT